ncbi:MAG: PD-(D/E)XK nuclease family protein [Armatimonadetes bacterium]|nr:PD-(D/E)XK nuclease family protein [Armatimonadota bacterium]
MPGLPFGSRLAGMGRKRQARARKPQISPTKIRVFLECPLMYKLVYITKSASFYYTPNAGDSFGGTLHRAIHDFYAAGGHSTQTAEELVERLQSTWTSTGYSSLQEESAHQEFGARLLEEYYANSRSGSITLFTERQLREDMGEFVLIGRIDRLDERPDGTLEIIDYKTGRGSVTEEEVARDLAMSIYQLLARRKYPGRQVIATIHCLRTGISASAYLTDPQTVELEQFIREVAAGMLAITEDTDILPERKPACDTCKLSRICERAAMSDER